MTHNRCPRFHTLGPRRLAAVTLAALALALLPVVSSAEPVRVHGDLVSIFTGDSHVAAGTERSGTVVNLGGKVVIEGELDGDVVVLFGSLELRGVVDGDVVGVMSSLDASHARVEGNVVNVLGGLRRDGLDVSGQFVNLGLGDWFPGFWRLLFWLRALGLLVVFLTLVLAVALAPDRIAAMAEEAPVRYVPAFFVGLLAYVGLLALFVPVAVTVLGLPLLLLAWHLVKWLGVAALFLTLGRRVGRAFGADLSPLGAVLAVFAVWAASVLALGLLGPLGLLLIAVARTGFWLLFEVPGVGLALLSRFGSRAPSAANISPTR